MIELSGTKPHRRSSAPASPGVSLRVPIFTRVLPCSSAQKLILMNTTGVALGGQIFGSVQAWWMNT